MKIEIESIDDLNQLVSVLSPAYLRAFNTDLGPSFRAADIAHDVRTGSAGIQVDDESDSPSGLPGDIAPPCAVGYTASERTFDEVQKDAEAAHAELVGPERDADGALYDTRWHSEPKKLTDKGVFRARRGRDNDAYKAWLLEQAVEAAEAAIAADEAEPVATETHALPQGDVQVEAETAGETPEAPATPASAVDLEKLIAGSRETLALHSGAHVDLLNECRIFVDKHGHPAFTALKEAAVQGRSIPQLNEIEDRQLMQACIANYPSKEA